MDNKKEIKLDLDPRSSDHWFAVLDKLTEPNWCKWQNNEHFSKLIPVGDCDVHDYHRGFIYVQVFIIPVSSTHGKIRIWYATADDADYGGWGEIIALPDAETIVRQVGEIYSNMDSLPNEYIMNQLLKPFNITVEYE